MLSVVLVQCLICLVVQWYMLFCMRFWQISFQYRLVRCLLMLQCVFGVVVFFRCGSLVRIFCVSIFLVLLSMLQVSRWILFIGLVSRLCSMGLVVCVGIDCMVISVVMWFCIGVCLLLSCVCSCVLLLCVMCEIKCVMNIGSLILVMFLLFLGLGNSLVSSRLLSISRLFVIGMKKYSVVRQLYVYMNGM